MHRKTTFAIALFSLLLPFSVSAFGVSPPWINQGNLVPGSHYEKTITLSRSDDAEELLVEAEFDVSKEMDGWFSINKGLKFSIPAGQQQYPIVVKVDIPDNAELGVYSGYLRMKTMPKSVDLKTTGASIAVGVRVDINLTVGDNIIIDFAVHKVDILDIREGDPAQVLIKFENKGNVSVAPDRATFDLFDKYGEVRLGYSQIEDLPKVASFITEDFVVDFDLPLKLAQGEYWAEAKVFKDGAIIGQQKTIFNVVEKKGNTFIYITGVIVLVILAGASFFIRKRFL